MAILFDLDGTLLDTAHDLHAAINLTLQHENKAPVSYELIRNHVSFGSRAMLAVALNLELAGNPEHTAYVEQLVPLFMDCYMQTEYKNTAPFAGIEELLLAIETANLPWGIVTNKNSALTDPLLKVVGYFNRTPCIVSGNTAARAKPAPDPLLYACNLLQVQPADCIYVGDALTDIQAGKAAGMRTIAAAFGFVPANVSVADWQADFIVNSPSEIFPWIQKWSKRIL